MAKVIFLHLSVILFTGGFCLNACWDTNPPGQGRPPPPEQTPPPPPRSRHHHSRRTRQTPPGAYPPRTRQTTHPPRSGRPPLDQADPPPGKQTPAYGLRAAGTHPTLMHSCLVISCFAHGFRNWKSFCWGSSPLYNRKMLVKICLFVSAIRSSVTRIIGLLPSNLCNISSETCVYILKV